MRLEKVSIIVPFYRNSLMLRRQLEEWEKYPPGFTFIVVDDGSPESALDVVQQFGIDRIPALILFRIDVDIPWNRGGARNLGAKMALTDWIIQIDIDHLLPYRCAQPLLMTDVYPQHWYRFERWRVGTADATRKKDKIADSIAFGQIHPHVDSYLCTKDLYWKIGGYDEDYSGCLGGGNPFLHQLEKAQQVAMFPPHAHLHVHTRSAVEDASDNTLSRDTSEYSRRRKEKQACGNTKATNPIRFPWKRVL